ncbi:MAG: SpoIIE family protein phosphatase [Phycisphaerae bacterium]
MARLVVTLPDGRMFTHTLGDAPQIVGRDSTCDIAIDDPSTSRRHARIYPTQRGYVVEDLDSKNSTFVNDERCSSHLLEDRDKIVFGSVEAVYSDDAVSTSHSVVIADNLTATHATRYAGRDQRLELSRQRLQMIYELSERLTTLQGRDQLLEDAMDIGFETLYFERGAFGLRRPDGRLLDWPVVRNLYGAHGELTVSRTLLNRALEYGERAIFTDAGAENADPTVSMVQQGIRSAMCVPLIHADEILGVFYGDRIRSSVSYTDEDIDFLAAIARQVSIGLINCRLVDEQRQTARLRHDVKLARTIQTGLFPAKLPNRHDVRVAAINDPGQRVSGDYYDVIETPDGRIWCLVADVTGEGAAAALLMANLQAAVRVTIGETDDPSALLTRWNRLICSNTDSSKFITCVLSLIDPESRTMRLAGAGHFSPLVIRPTSDTVQKLELEAALPLGVDEPTVYTTTEIDLAKQPCTVLYYSDGVTEAMNPSREMFGERQLLDLLVAHRSLSPLALIKQIRKSVASFVAGAPQSDDITLLAASLA